MGDFAEKFLRGMEVGRAQKSAREEHESNVERRKLERDRLNLEIRKNKHQEATEAFNLKQQTAKMQYDLLNGAPTEEGAPEPAAVQFPGMTADPEAGTSDVPGVTAQPQSARKILQAKLAGMRLEGGVKNDLEKVNVPHGMLPGMEGPTDPTIFKGGVDLAQSKMTAQTAAAGRSNAMAIAKLPYEQLGAGGGNHTIDQIADAVKGGQYKISDVPPKLKLSVMKSLADRGKVIVPPKVQEKMDAFTPAIAGLDKLEMSLDKAINPKAGLTDRAMALLQYKVESRAFTRVVGRSLGEKGMFTDQDSKAFEDLISAGVVAAATAPGMAKQRLGEARTFMEGIQHREIDSFFERQGSAGPVPGPGNLPPKVKGKIRVRRGRPGSSNEGKQQWSSDDGATWNEGQPPAGVQ